MASIREGGIKPSAGMRVALPITVSLILAAVATLYPPWAILATTVPLGTIVSIAIARGPWRNMCLRVGAATVFVVLASIATHAAAGDSGAIAGCLPCTLAMLLYAWCSALPSPDSRSRFLACVSATVSAGVASLIVLVGAIDSLFSPLLTTDHAGDAVAFAALLLGGPALILFVRLSVPWSGNAGRNADVGAVAAFVAGIGTAILFGHLSRTGLVSDFIQLGANALALILLVQCVITGARSATQMCKHS